MSPLYIYECEHGHRAERLLPMTGTDGPRPCPVCKEPSRRVMTAPRLRRDGAYSYGRPAQ